MFEMPILLPYPQIADIKLRPELSNIFCYVIKGYKPGYSLLFKRYNDHAGIRIGNWYGGLIDPDDTVHSRPIIDNLLGKIAGQIGSIMHLIKVDQAQYYFAEDQSLVDVQLSLNKFIGPGMLRDLFAKMMPVQQTLELTKITPEKVTSLMGLGYQVVIKPSKFRYQAVMDKVIPVYATIG